MISVRVAAAVMALLVCWSGTARADLMWGANGHPLVSYPGVSFEKQLDYLKDLGLKSYRVDVTRIGSIPALRNLIKLAKARQIEILPVLVPPVDLEKDSVDELYRKARAFAVLSITPLKDEVRTWELGNELENFAIIKACEMQDDGVQYNCAWGPAGGVGALEYYGPRWKKVSAVLKGLSDGAISVDPGIRKAIGTAGWGHLGVFDRMVSDGIAWDISVWHMYGEDPEWAFKKLAEFKKPIWVTEFNNPFGSQAGELAQADGLRKSMARLRELQKTYNVEAAHIYELMDETYWAPDAEAVMGLMRLEKAGVRGWRPGPPKLAYHVVRQLVLSGGEGSGASADRALTGRDCDIGSYDASDGSIANQVAFTYCLMVGRKADAHGAQTWTDAREKGLSAEELLIAVMKSDEYRDRYAIDRLSNKEFVQLQYRLLLGREADGRGLDDFVGELDRKEKTREDFVKALIGSDEFRKKRALLFPSAVSGAAGDHNAVAP
jgi:hypothetical protein